MNKLQTVLVADDEPNNVAILSKDLSTFCRVLVARNGVQALKRVEENQVDLILLDIMMPEMDGHEVCRRLKDNSATKNIPVIFLTAKNDVEDETFGLELGAVDYIKKPFSLPIVRARVTTHLELKKKTDTLEKLAALDGLTGIPNRRLFDEFLKREWGRSLRNKKPLTVIMLDVDHFKLFNDHYGHLEGDECLKRLAGSLSASLRRPADLLARYGGEEFVAVLVETDFEGAELVAQNMLDNVNALKIPHEYSKTAPHVSISVGIASTAPENASVSSNTLVQAADKMLYKAKEGGRNRVYGEDLVL